MLKCLTVLSYGVSDLCRMRALFLLLRSVPPVFSRFGVLFLIRFRVWSNESIFLDLERLCFTIFVLWVVVVLVRLFIVLCFGGSRSTSFVSIMLRSAIKLPSSFFGGVASLLVLVGQGVVMCAPQCNSCVLKNV